MAREPLQRPGVLVLGGGGTLGEAWLRAVLAGIEAEAGWDLRECDGFVGTSAGSIVAAVLAAGRRPETAAALAREWEAATAAGEAAGAGRTAPLAAGVRAFGGLAATAAAPLAPLALAALTPGGAVARAAILRAGPEPTREVPRLRELLERIGGTFDGRLRVTAVDRRTGKRVVFGAPGAPPAGVTEAVLASCAVPWVFRPLTIGGREYVDGGVWSAANLDAAPAGRGTEVLCLNPTASPRLARDPLGAVRGYATATTAAEAAAVRRRGARVTVVAPDAASIAAVGPTLFDPRRRPQVEAAGYAQGRALAG